MFNSFNGIGIKMGIIQDIMENGNLHVVSHLLVAYGKSIT